MSPNSTPTLMSPAESRLQLLTEILHECPGFRQLHVTRLQVLRSLKRFNDSVKDASELRERCGHYFFVLLFWLIA